MAVLQQGDAGDMVLVTQKLLTAHGFSPGLPDGDFGPGTEAAVIAFQKSEGLTPDGIVGALTAAALAAPPDRAPGGQSIPPQPVVSPPRTLPRAGGLVDAFRTIATVSYMLPAAPLSNINRHLPYVIAALDERGMSDQTMFLMANATIAAEVGAYRPINEGESRYNTSPNGHSFDLYDNRKDLGNRGYPDGSLFRGRGFVQLTGRSNYEAADAALKYGGMLVKSPNMGNDPEAAARILAWFLSRNELRIRTAIRTNDLALARKIVNGGSHGLETFVYAYNRGLYQWGKVKTA